MDQTQLKYLFFNLALLNRYLKGYNFKRRPFENPVLLSVDNLKQFLFTNQALVV